MRPYCLILNIMDAAVERPQSTVSQADSNKQLGRESSLATPTTRQTAKGGVSSSAASVASSDHARDGSSDLQSSGDGALDKFKSRGSDAGSEASSHRRRMSKIFKTRRRRRKSDAQDDVSPGEPVPPLPDTKPMGVDPPFQSEESLGLHSSAPSSLLTEDEDTEP